MTNHPHILLKDPHSHVVNHDTGFGNRLHCWNVLCNLNNTSNLPILANEYEFPELHHIDIPNLQIIPPDSNTLLSYPTYPSQRIQDYQEITSTHLQMYQEMGDLELDKKLKWVTNYSWDDIHKFIYHKSYKTTNFTNIKFKSKELQDLIIDFSQNLVSIHLRRGGGVRTTPYDLKDIPTKALSYFSITPESTQTSNYPFFQEEYLINIIEKLLLEKPNLKIYLSLDLEENTVSHIKERYGSDRILTRSVFTNQYKNLLTQLKLHHPIQSLTSIGNNLIDFFILAHSSFSIHSLYSTWGSTGKLITNKPFIDNHPDNNVDVICREYHKSKI